MDNNQHGSGVSFAMLLQNLLPVCLFGLMVWVGNNIEENGDHVVAMQAELTYVKEALTELKAERSLLREALASQHNLGKTTQDALERLKVVETKMASIEIRVSRIADQLPKPLRD